MASIAVKGKFDAGWTRQGARPGERGGPRFTSPPARAIVRRMSEADARCDDDPLEARRRRRDGGPLEPGHMLGGRFRLVELLGRGGFAEVWKALDHDDRWHPVAVKILHGHLARDGSALERFGRGARHMRRLNNRHIVRVRETVCADGPPHFFVMDLVDGVSLTEHLTSGRLDPAAVPELIRQAGEALTCAHRAGVIHRDVHPGNMLVSPDGTVTLIDFDLVLDPDTTGGTRTGALGTAIFAAPESYHRPQDATETADVFGLAMTAAACWLGRLPHMGDHRSFDAFIDALPCTPAQRRALRTALAIEPTARHASIEALCDALQLPAAGMIARREPEKGQRDWRRGEANPLAALALPPAVAAHLRAPWDGDDLLNALRSLPAGGISRRDARAALWSWITPERTTEELAYAWYALEMAGLPVDRAAFFALCARPLPIADQTPAWIDVPGGTFVMGSRRKGESPPHPVTLSPFAMSATLVEARHYAAFDASYPFALAAEHPVSGVTWWEAMLFARWADARLPTEAEWEHACRAGSTGRYSFGDDPAELSAHAWCKPHSESRMHPVGLLAANAFGLYDMHGLLFEWCADWHAPYAIGSPLDPRGPTEGIRRVMRGSSYKSNAATTRASHREHNHPGSRHHTRGIRLARSLPVPPTLARALDPSPALTSPPPPPTPPALTPAAGSTTPSPPTHQPRTLPVTPIPRPQVFDAYWYFAAERQRIFYRRLAGQPGPWTADPILTDYKFCNAFRASDRVSQYLIREVIYRDDHSRDAEDVIFRTLLFRLFNKIETWPTFCAVAGGEPRAKSFDPARYGKALDAEMNDGQIIFGNAYMIAPPSRVLGGDFNRKHDGYLALLQHMLRDGIVGKIERTRTLGELYRLLVGYPLIGKFIAYQLATDLNYTEVVDFDEDSFTQAGPGAVRGIAKCFESRGGLTDEGIIRWMVDHQREQFEERGTDPQQAWLWGRPLKAIDCQNLFCETDKYSRVAFPDLKSNRSRIKAKFTALARPIRYFYPPKWGLNDRTAHPPVEIPPTQATHRR